MTDKVEDPKTADEPHVKEVNTPKAKKKTGEPSPYHRYLAPVSEDELHQAEETQNQWRILCDFYDQVTESNDTVAELRPNTSAEAWLRDAITFAKAHNDPGDLVRDHVEEAIVVCFARCYLQETVDSCTIVLGRDKARTSALNPSEAFRKVWRARSEPILVEAVYFLQLYCRETDLQLDQTHRMLQEILCFLFRRPVQRSQNLSRPLAIARLQQIMESDGFAKAALDGMRSAACYAVGRAQGMGARAIERRMSTANKVNPLIPLLRELVQLYRSEIGPTQDLLRVVDEVN